NPPIDPIRERSVMSLNTGFGPITNVLSNCEDHSKRIKTTIPIMSEARLKLLLEFGDESHERYLEDYKAKSYSTAFGSDLQTSLYALVANIVADVRDNGIRTIVLDDRDLDSNNKAIPMLMVVGHLNQELLDAKLRHLISIIPATGEVFDPHSAALMLGYGATTVFPYLLYYTITELLDEKDDVEATLKRSRRAIGAGILKIMSKMGISTLASYRNSKLFDIIGLSDKIVKDCFDGSIGLLSGLCYADIEERLNSNHQRAFTDAFEGKRKALYKGGFYKYKKGEEFHDFSRATIDAMQLSADTGDKAEYEKVKVLVNQRDKKFIRDFYELSSDREAISIDEVEPLENIFKRFSSAAMSMGSISQEAHETLAIAMNSIGAKSNSGEGGESKERLHDPKRNSKIKQIASGRFGVTPEYLRSAEEIQIKVAQGAKPGEGGQLPGSKVTPLIA
ncbi:MAG: glutamate synthase large subunit, partial [Sulfurovaceae bacterium]|nr:glutamate synthase large subunit [Sulfurovaceae bacterium]